MAFIRKLRKTILILLSFNEGVEIAMYVNV